MFGNNCLRSFVFCLSLVGLSGGVLSFVRIWLEKREGGRDGFFWPEMHASCVLYTLVFIVLSER